MSDTIERSAIISDCGQYRYLLTRRWGEGPAVMWCCLNPSKADATEDDPSIRKMYGFSKRLGYSALEVVNLFAVRATDPKDMKKHIAPIGPENDGHIHDAAHRALRGAAIICAWGEHGRFRNRDLHVGVILSGMAPKCLGLTASGAPRHPLMLGYDRAKLEAYRG